MGNIDSIPIISQVKSLVQVIGGDARGARETQENFSRQCPGVSQVRSLVEVIGGDANGARETQESFVRGLSDFADGIPGIGHVKGAIHFAAGDSTGGEKAMKSASRTVAVVGSGVGGFLIGGPVGAVAGGVAGGASYDGLVTGIDSAIKGEYRPYGVVNSVTKGINGKASIGDAFDTGFGVAMDGFTGYQAGVKIGPKVQAYRELRNVAKGPELAQNVQKAHAHKLKLQEYESYGPHKQQQKQHFQSMIEENQNQLSKAGISFDELKALHKENALHKKKIFALDKAEKILEKEVISLSKDAKQTFGKNRVHALTKARAGQVAVNTDNLGRLIFDTKEIPNKSTLKFSLRDYTPNHDYSNPISIPRAMTMGTTKILAPSVIQNFKSMMEEDD